MAKTGIALVAIAGMFLALPGRAAPTDPALMATPPQPSWQELTVAQKIILAPLSDDWDAMEFYRRKTWLNMATRFAEMTPQEQRRIQEQMQAWAKLSPEEQIIAREIYQKTANMPAAQKQQLRQQWEEYSNLPEAEKEKLKRAANKRPFVNRTERPTTVSPLNASGVSATSSTSNVSGPMPGATPAVAQTAEASKTTQATQKP